MTVLKSPSGSFSWAGVPSTRRLARPAFAEESSSIAHTAPNPRDDLRGRLRLLYSGLILAPLAAVGVALWLLGAPPEQLAALGLIAFVAWMVVLRLASYQSTTGHRWITTLSQQCCAIDSQWRYVADDLRAEPEMPAELRRLYRDFDRMARRLDGSMVRLRTAVAEGEDLRAELEGVLKSRDEEIRSRTVELQVANLDLERLAREDGLTGISNHRRFVEFAKQIWRIAIREDKPVAVLMIDVDHFKAYNDIYGHQAGDQCLKKVSAAIESICRRPLDLAARYGGEEFAVVLGHTELEDAFQLAEQARLKVVELDIAHSGSSDYGVVTVSLGVACLHPHRDTEVTTLIALADKALYRAKRNGRNRTAK